MSDTTDLVQRLRKDKWHVSAVTREEAADTIEALQAERDALRDGLLTTVLVAVHHAVEECISATGQRRVIDHFVNKTHLANEALAAIDAAMKGANT